MLKRFITLINSALLGLLALNFSPWAMAQGQADFDQPIRIFAEDEFFDIKRSMAVFERNVRVSQGTLLIQADRLMAENDSESGARVFVATGDPATYEQQLDDGSMIRAQANEIRYDQQNQLLTLSGAAEVSQNNSLVRGGVLQYDFVKQTLTSERSDDEPVETIITPRPRNNPEDGTEGTQG